MSENKKPRIAEILGVEVGERFSVEGQRGGDPLYVNRDGWVRYVGDGAISTSAVTIAINHPDRIIRKPRWTEQDVEDAKALKRMIKNAHHVRRCVEEVSLRLYGKYDDYILTLNNCFAALPPQTEVTLDEIIGGAE